MNLDAVVLHLRSAVSAFDGRVAGAAEFARGLETEAQMALPAAYVVPLDEDAAENTLMNGLVQIVTERIGIIVEFDNTADRRGQSVTSQFDAMRSALWAALLNWRIDPVRATRGLEYAGGQLREFDRARLFYQWEFTLQITVTDRDGWHEPSTPLTTLGLTAAHGSTTLVTAEIDLPQT